MKPYLHFSGAHWEKKSLPRTHMWSREFYGRRVIRWTPHPETVNRIVSLAGKVVSAPTLSPLIVGKISDTLVWVTTGNVRCTIHMSHLVTVSCDSRGIGGDDRWYRDNGEQKHTHLCVVRSWRDTNRRYTGVFLLYFGPIRTFRNSWRLAVAV